jgi:hypothetical protein
VDLTTNADLTRIKAHLLDTMNDYMQSFENDGDEAPYSAADIQRCAAILDAFVANVGSVAGNAELIMAAVQDTVLSLNDLSEKSEGLIETDQREDLCEFIELAARAGGLNVDVGEDITEEWREW